MARPLKFQSVIELQQKIDEFFDLIKEGTESPSVIGLACHLGTNKQTILNYQDREEFKETIESAKERIEGLFTTKAYNGNIPPAIFIFTAKNHYEYKESQDVNQRYVTKDGEDLHSEDLKILADYEKRIKGVTKSSDE